MKTFSKSPAEKLKRRISCDLCGSDHASVLWSFDGWSVEKCKKCGLVYQNPQPDLSELRLRYDNEYFDYEICNEDAFFDLMTLGLSDVGFEDIEKECFGRSDANGPLFVDVGCATGKLLKHADSRGWRTMGVEICGAAADFGRKRRGLDIFTGTIEDACIDDSTVDLIHSSHFIEHLCRPSAYLKEAERILKPGGYMVTVTPNIDGFQAKLFGSSWRSAIADHMYLFSIKSLTAMMEKQNLKPVKIATWGGLAAGTAPAPVKKAADRLVKVFGWGDVVSILSVKQI